MNKFYAISIMTLLCFLFQIAAQPVEKAVGVSVSIDGRIIKSDKLKIEIQIRKRKITPRIIGDGFSLDWLNGVDENEHDIDLRVYYERYLMEFGKLSKAHFEDPLKISITTAPFIDKRRLHDAEKVDYLYMIEFPSKGGEATIQYKIIYK